MIGTINQLLILMIGIVGMALFHDAVQAAGAITAAVANRVDLGDIILPTGNWTITRVWGQSIPVGTWTASEGIQGYVQIESTDCAIAPCQFLLEPSTAGIGTGGNQASQVEPRKWIVNAPARGGSVLNVYHVCDSTISTATSETLVTVEFTEGGSPFPGEQVHMKCGEPGVAASASDGGVASLSDIEIKGTRIYAVAAYASVTTSVADTSTQLMMEITSDDLAPDSKGPQRFGLGQQGGGEATNHPAGLSMIQLTELDLNLKSPGQKHTLSAAVTSYDALTTGPMCNWCLLFA